MTSKEKANELVNKMDLKQRPSLNIARNEINLNETFFNAKQCALIAVDEILEMDLPILEEDADKFYDYWEEVKQEIEEL